MKKVMGMVAAAAGLLVVGQQVGAEPVGPLVEQYKSAGTAVVDMVNSKSVNVTAVEAKVLELTKASVAMAKAYETAHPEGAKLLETVIGQVAGNVEAVSEVTQSANRSAQEAAEMARGLSDQSERLRTMVGRFKTQARRAA